MSVPGNQKMFMFNAIKARNLGLTESHFMKNVPDA